ncbi:hypothetical protein [Acinetobacter baylyi]|uniref:hypothetical protein n=1 Tax=Acinetobacter baylyi TaxID=202950 RepID=UPI00286787FA|nr:hypothetical protein [Acinetobacter baylyi]
MNSRKANSEIKPNNTIKAIFPKRIAAASTISMTHQALILAFKLSITGDRVSPERSFKINPTADAKTRIAAKIPKIR